MNPQGYYRQKAQEARARELVASDPEIRAQWRDIARQFEQLAAYAERSSRQES
jgi:hypothetical protein